MHVVAKVSMPPRLRESQQLRVEEARTRLEKLLTIPKPGRIEAIRKLLSSMDKECSSTLPYYSGSPIEALVSELDRFVIHHFRKQWELAVEIVNWRSYQGQPCPPIQSLAMETDNLEQAVKIYRDLRTIATDQAEHALAEVYGRVILDSFSGGSAPLEDVLEYTETLLKLKPVNFVDDWVKTRLVLLDEAGREKDANKLADLYAARKENFFFSLRPHSKGQTKSGFSVVLGIRLKVSKFDIEQDYPPLRKVHLDSTEAYMLLLGGLLGDAGISQYITRFILLSSYHFTVGERNYKSRRSVASSIGDVIDELNDKFPRIVPKSFPKRDAIVYKVDPRTGRPMPKKGARRYKVDWRVTWQKGLFDKVGFVLHEQGHDSVLTHKGLLKFVGEHAPRFFSIPSARGTSQPGAPETVHLDPNTLPTLEEYHDKWDVIQEYAELLGSDLPEETKRKRIQELLSPKQEMELQNIWKGKGAGGFLQFFKQTCRVKT